MATEAVERRPGVRTGVGTASLPAAIGAGQLAGLVMAAAVVAVFALFLGRHPLFPVQVISAFALGEGALARPTLGNQLVGVLLHQLGPSLFWSLIFYGIVAAMERPVTLGTSLLIGFFVGGLAMIIDVYLLMPPIQRALHGTDLWAANVPRGWDWIAHLTYGLSLGALYHRLRPRLPRR